VARELAAGGARLLVHGRDAGRAREVAAEVGSDQVYLADLASLDEVRRLASEVARDHESLDVLVSNAGIGSTLPGDGARLESADGLELRFAVNYLAGWLLTRLLEPLLVRADRDERGGARIVNVASAGQMAIDFDDVMLEHGYSGVRAYCQSKLAQVMATFDLADRLAGDGVTANALHPATYMPTKIVLHAGAAPASSLEQGTEATVRLAADPALDGVSGHYFDGLREARADPQAYDAGARRRLWELSERLTGLGGEASSRPRATDPEQRR
jgi:NAD(P)-dependent dehydrogenase (short-subunit alcohol dehydrogenase family)